MTMFLSRAFCLGALIWAIGLGSQSAQAELLRILFINDLHGHLEHATDPQIGGYAALKAKIDELRNQSEANGIPVLSLNSGDSLEGSPFYFANRSREVFRALEALELDATVIGNHDWLMGPSGLNELLGFMRPKMQFLGANFYSRRKRRNTRRYVRPHAEFVRGHLRIGVFGLTTKSPLYSWRNDRKRIRDPLLVANREIRALRDRNDLVIALTHIGLGEDQKLVRWTNGIDLVVGGHSHTFLESPVFQKDIRGKKTPIVQAGKHGEVVGNLLIDVEPGRKPNVLQYELVPVFRDQARDPHLEEIVSDARSRLESDYGRDWLYEPLGYSNTPLINPTRGATFWGNFHVEAMREATGADTAFDVGEFFGNSQPSGSITRETLMALYPRMFEFSQKFGWDIWTARVWGSTIKILIRESVKRNVYFPFAGVTYRKKKNLWGKTKAHDIRLDGKRIRDAKLYRVALPEGIARGGIAITPLIKLLVQFPKDTGIPVWSALERKVRRMGTIDSDPRLHP